MMKKRIAFVVQRCGAEVNGGAELLCRVIAERLGRLHDTEVLTTCALDYMTWADHYPPGEQRIGDLRVRRFRVPRPRDVASFNRLSESIRPRIGALIRAEEEEWMRAQGPWSPDLFEYLEREKARYDAFVFFTYLYATTFYGLPIVADRAVLVPTAHDEWPIHLGIWDRFMALPRAFVFNSEEERAFLRRRFQARLDGPVVGVAVDPPGTPDAAAFRRDHGVDAPFALYLGRVDATKGVGELLEYFRPYRDSSGDRRTELILAGKRVMDLPREPRVRALGFLSEAEKWNALAACELLAMPSPYESLSMACLEAWSVGKPVLVTAKSEVLVGQCRRSQGGLWYRDADEFAEALGCLLGDETLRRTLGQQGQRFVRENYHWPHIVDQYDRVLAGVVR